MCGQHLRTEYLRLREEAARCRPGSDIQQEIYDVMAAMTRLHERLGLGPIAQSHGMFYGPGPTHVKAGMG